MNRYGSRKHRVAAGLAMVALMVVVAVAATTVDEPEANALPFGGGIPVRVYFNPDPAKAGDTVELWVELSEAATLTTHFVALDFPAVIQDPTASLTLFPRYVTVALGNTDGYVPITIQSAQAQGYVTVIATINGGRAGGVLEFR